MMAICTCDGHIMLYSHPYLEQDEAVLYGIGPLSVEDAEETVRVPVTPCPMDEDFLDNLYETIITL